MGIYYILQFKFNISYSRAASSDTLTLGTNAPKQSVRILAMDNGIQT